METNPKRELAFSYRLKRTRLRLLQKWRKTYLTMIPILYKMIPVSLTLSGTPLLPKGNKK